MQQGAVSNTVAFPPAVLGHGEIILFVKNTIACGHGSSVL
jgi:hypothetical protein